MLLLDIRTVHKVQLMGMSLALQVFNYKVEDVFNFIDGARGKARG